jgi:medium-chain acyl-[acyl-carrier-protein] hydrolase
MNVQPDDLKSWVYQSAGQGSCRLRLFCLPYAGGGAAVYRLWPGAMPPGVELCRIQLPGHESRLREQPYDRLADLVDTMSTVIRPLLDVPFAFFGHSMGALISFEMTRAVRRKHDLMADHLFVSAWRAPQMPLGSALHRLPEAEFIEKLQARFEGIPDGVLQDREILELMLPILRADLAVCETYKYAVDRPFDCPITVFGGIDDHWVNAAELAGWEAHTNGSTNVNMLPGDHFFINDERQSLAHEVANTLAHAMSGE